MSTFTEIAVKRTLGNHRAIARLMIYFNCHSETIKRWFRKNSEELQTPHAIAIIKEETGLREDEILEAIEV